MTQQMHPDNAVPADNNISETEGETLSVEELVEMFDLYNYSVNKAKSTVERYRYSLGHFTAFMKAETPVTAITATRLDMYRVYLKRDKGLSVISINSYLRDLRALFIWATNEERQYMKRRPAIQFLMGAEPEPPEVLTEEEYQKVLAATQEAATLLERLRDRAIVKVLRCTGMRASELCNAKWKHLEHPKVDGQTAHVLTIKGAKTGRWRPVLLHEDVWQAVKAYREELAQAHGRSRKLVGYSPDHLFVSTRRAGEDTPLSRGALTDLFERLEERSGVHCNPHKWRHTLAEDWMNKTEGEGIDMLMEYAGWVTRDMVKVYGRYKATTVVRAARRNAPRAARVKREAAAIAEQGQVGQGNGKEVTTNNNGGGAGKAGKSGSKAGGTGKK